MSSAASASCDKKDVFGIIVYNGNTITPSLNSVVTDFLVYLLKFSCHLPGKGHSSQQQNRRLLFMVLNLFRS